MTQVLDWCSWRRWHQRWARTYHERRRARGDPVARTTPAVAQERATFAVVWHRLEAVVATLPQRGRPTSHDRRLMLEAMVYVMDSGCGWPDLPARFPPWKTVYGQFARWRTAGIWDAIWSGRESCDLQL